MQSEPVGFKAKFIDDATDAQRASVLEVLEHCDFIKEINDWVDGESEEFAKTYTITEYAQHLTNSGIMFNRRTAVEILDEFGINAVGKKMKKKYKTLMGSTPQTKPFRIPRSDGTVDVKPACAYTEEDHDFFVLCMMNLVFTGQV